MALQEAKRKAREEAAKLADAQERARLAALPEEPTYVSYACCRVCSAVTHVIPCQAMSWRVAHCGLVAPRTRK